MASRDDFRFTFLCHACKKGNFLPRDGLPLFCPEAGFPLASFALFGPVAWRDDASPSF